ncbi:MAG: M61 family metallopeptidase [Caulobacter sp.]|nr:M61 family metallopeptidase [Caulobacter sp.]
MFRCCLAIASVLFFAGAAVAQPQPSPLPEPRPAPRDAPYPGLIKLTVDSTDLDHRIFKIRETIPVAGPGPMTLLYPQWLPGNHAPRGPIEKLAGLTISANGEKLAWVRDTVDVYAFHLDVPAGVKELQVEFQFLSPTTGDQGRIVMTREMLNLQWNFAALYPAGYFTRQIMVEPTVILPEGWKFGVALDPAQSEGDRHTFKPVSFETLVDSPMFAGRYYRQVDLDPGGRSPVKLNIVADREDLLDASDEQIEKHRNLVTQADRLFGTRQYDRYDFLLSLTDRMGGIGLEHHRSSENGVEPEYFTNWSRMAPERGLLPHEYTHSWNGKFRRGADLWTPDYSTPMRDSLLWVYEGQTQFWGYVLGARSGLLSRQDAMDVFANTAAAYDARVGREWRDLQDTTNDPIIAARRPKPFVSWQRSEDYYSEGLLVWLDADSLIRERTGGKKSLDDFARRFFGRKDGSYESETYDFDDVVEALNAVTPYDWAGFLKARLTDHAKGAPLDGLTRSGWKLTYAETPNAFQKAGEALYKRHDFTYSVGLTIKAGGGISGVQWEGPAFKSGLVVGMTVVAVNGESYSAERMRDAITGAKDGKAPLQLIVKDGERYVVVDIPWTGGLRYPHLERIEGTPDRLSVLFAPLKR